MLYATTAAGGTQLALPAAAWPPGVYLVRVRGAATVQTVRLLRH